MSRRPNPWMVVAMATACALVASACGRSGSAAEVSPVSGLVVSTHASTRPVSSVIWATNRDVISLDPIFALG